VKVYAAINSVQADLAKEGITKNRKNQAQGYNFRGIDDVYNALSGLLSSHGLCIIPRYLSRTCVDRETQKGGSLFNVTVEAEYDVVCSEDGSKHTARTYGEAMDSADKATNKAMSAAYKYLCLQLFAIPTEGDNDADAHTPTPASIAQQRIQQLRKPVMPEVDAHPERDWTQLDPEPALNPLPASQRSATVTPLDVAELASAKGMDATKKAKPSVSFEMLEAFKVVKSELAKITGSDSKYYDLLGGFGYEKSSQIPTRELGQKVYKGP